MTLLNITALEAAYGASQVLFGVNLSVAEGEVVALMGRNGMGKTTTISTLTRMMGMKSGDIQFGGTSLNRLPSHKAAQLGIGLVPEGRRCFPNLTVEENLIVAARDGEWDFEKVAQLFPRLKERRDQLSSSLSGGEQQMLAIGRALMTNPRLLILDEATEGLAPVVRQEIWTAIRTLKAQSGLSLLVVDKSLKELASVADRAVILEKGRDVWSGAPADLTADITTRYLGV
ncbi:ABC transporter ATP-binding protein [Cochlodiniinecator piscidefendens]|uniref:ABC transporter ATP-binding protein n=1 Tax=Cochlodiniinecator piscidefendens TaxID=2715756 RepID=UPI0014087160|nr:ABC transporter ATP-binding protein [Cochlodiniinecator piscidefendens]